MEKVTIKILEEQRESFLSEIGVYNVNELSVKQSETKGYLDISFQCDPLTIYYIGMRFQLKSYLYNTK